MGMARPRRRCSWLMYASTKIERSRTAWRRRAHAAAAVGPDDLAPSRPSCPGSVRPAASRRGDRGPGGWREALQLAERPRADLDHAVGRDQAGRCPWSSRPAVVDVGGRRRLPAARRPRLERRARGVHGAAASGGGRGDGDRRDGDRHPAQHAAHGVIVAPHVPAPAGTRRAAMAAPAVQRTDRPRVARVRATPLRLERQTGDPEVGRGRVGARRSARSTTHSRRARRWRSSGHRGPARCSSRMSRAWRSQAACPRLAAPPRGRPGCVRRRASGREGRARRR